MLAVEHEAYYSAMAQALPLLFVVLLVEFAGTKASWEPIRNTLPKGGLVVPLGLIAAAVVIGLGEFASLDALRRDSVTGLETVLIDAAISVAAFGLLAPVVAVLLDEMEAPPSVKLAVATIVLCIWLAAILYFMPNSPLR